MELSSSSLSSEEYLDYEEEDLNDEPEYAGITASWLRRAITTLSRVAELNSRRKFKSAVKIQAFYRGWITRRKLSSWNQAATKIQKTWRGLTGRWEFFKILESTIQRRIIEHHNKSATIIQCAYRGYYSRKYIHDHLKLRQLQLQATTDLLKCVALQARKLFKNHHLPGVYSLRNSKCRRKVDKMSTLLQMKTYNEEVRRAQAEEMLKLKDAFEKSNQSREMVPIPFGVCKK